MQRKKGRMSSAIKRYKLKRRPHKKIRNGRIRTKKRLRKFRKKKKITTNKPHLKKRKKYRLRKKGLHLKRRLRFNYTSVFEHGPVQVPDLQLPEVAHYLPDINKARGQRLNILYLVHQFYPDAYTGTEKFVLNLAREMVRKGHRVKVATYSDRGIDEYPHTYGEVVYREFEYEGVPILAYRHKHMDPAQTFEIGNHDLTAFAEKMIRQEQPSIIHIGHPMRAMEFMETSLRFGVPYIVTLTDFWFICPKTNMLHTNRNLCAGPEQGAACRMHCQIPDAEQRLNSHIPLLKAAQKVLSPSVFLASMVKNVIPDLNIEVLNHGMDYGSIHRNEKVYLPGAPLTLFYGGSLNHHKGVHLILEAMSLILSDRLRLKIYGSGSPSYMEKLKLAAARDSRVELCGLYAEADIQQIYQDADIAIVPSVWYENYPLVLHEALASHVPVLTSNVGGMTEKVKDGINGFTFRVGDASHLAERIKELLNNPSLLNTFKSNLNQIHIPAVEQESYFYENIYFSLAR